MKQSSNGNDEYYMKSNGSFDSDFYISQPGQGESEGEGDNELLRYMHMILDRKWLVLSCVLLFVLAAAFQLRKATPIYIASSTVKYEPTSLKVVDFGEVGRPVNAVDEIRTQVEIIRSPDITTAVIDALGMGQVQVESSTEKKAPESLTPLENIAELWKETRQSIRRTLVPPKEFQLPHDQLQKQGLVAQMRSKVSVRQRGDTKLIDIIVRDAHPVQAAKIANEYARQYQKNMMMSRTSTYERSETFFEQEVAEARKNLDAAKQKLLDYSEQSNTDLRMMEQETELALNMTKTLREQIEDLTNKVALYDVALEDDASNAIKTHLLSQDIQYTSIINRLNDLRLQEVTLSAVNQADNPELKSLRLQIATLEEQRAEHEKKFELESMGQALLAKRELSALKARVKEQERKFNDLQGEMIEYSALQMDVESNQSLYEQLLSRKKQINVASEVDSDNIDVLSLAFIPTVPSEPRVFNSLMMHAMIGFLIGCFMAVGIGWLDRSVHDPAQVQTQTGLAPIGIIPYMGGKFRMPFVKRRGKATMKLINTFDPYSSQAESFRLLRTNLQYSTAGKTPEVLMVTSCLPSEGKSTVSSNLAISFASLGERVLLIDADLKLPNLHRQFGVAKRPGLSDVLTGQVMSDQVIVNTDIANLDLMPAGPQSPSPVELLESADMTRLLDELRPKYDRVILDTAPLHGMSDSFVLANKVDGVCLVASVGRTRLDIMKRTVQSLQNMKVRVLGAVFNYQYGGSRSMPLYYYYKSGGYGYGGYADSRRGRYDRIARRESEEAIPTSKKS